MNLSHAYQYILGDEENYVYDKKGNLLGFIVSSDMIGNAYGLDKAETKFVTNREIFKNYKEATMNEKKASEYCHENETDERIKKLERTVKVLEKDLQELHTARYDQEQRIKQLEERHDPIPELTPIESRMLEICDEACYEWVAKDPDGVTFAFYDKPTLKEQAEGNEWNNGDIFLHLTVRETADFNGLPSDRPFKIADLIKEG